MEEKKDLKLRKMEFLGETMKRCLTREPSLTLEEIAVVIADEIEDLTLFLKKYKKQLTK